MPTNIGLGLLTNKTYPLNDVWAQRLSAQYVCTIMQYSIGCNIVDIANQLFFVYQGLAPEFQVFVLPPIKSTKAADFICAFEEK